MEFEGERKRSLNEMESIPVDVERKLAKCSNFFSVPGCPLWKECPFLHCDPDSINATMQTPGSPSHTADSGNQGSPPSPLKGNSLVKPSDISMTRVQQDIGKVGKEDCESDRIFQVSATTEIDASLAGEIIGKDGVNFKALKYLTGAKVDLKDHKFDRNLKIIKLKGTFDEIKVSSEMVNTLVRNVSHFSRSNSPQRIRGIERY